MNIHKQIPVWPIMLLLALLFFLPFKCQAEPIHQRINNWFHDGGYVDRWTWSHVVTGVIVTAALNYDPFWLWLYDKTGIREPSGTGKLAIAFCLSAAWETLEFSESNFNWSEYDKFYGGYAAENNGMDMLVQVGTTAAIMAPEIIWDIKLKLHGD